MPLYPTLRSRRELPLRKKWEYRLIAVCDDDGNEVDLLNEAGEDGWEAYAYAGFNDPDAANPGYTLLFHRHYLKRELRHDRA
jgi:hypothetical protein